MWITERNADESSLIKCPQDLLDIPHDALVLDFWLYTYLFEENVDNGGRFSSQDLLKRIQEILRYIQGAYGLAASVVHFFTKNQ